MCSDCDACFNDDQKTKLKEKGWTDNQINFVEHSDVEDKIKELI